MCRVAALACALCPAFAIDAVAQAPRSPHDAAEAKLVLDFWRVVIEARDLDHVGDYLAPDMIQHNPNMTNGIAGFAAFAVARWKGQLKQPVEAELRNKPAFVLVDGDLVQLVFRRLTPDPSAPDKTYDRFTFDLYRVSGGKLVEHWDNVVKPASVVGASQR